MKILRMSQKRFTRQSGFSLLEVLISMVVTSVGLLGLAGMQAAGIRSNHSAYHHSQATVLAYDMADRIRSNVGSAALYAATAPAKASEVELCKTSCGMSDMVQNDLFDWNVALTDAIPGSVGEITQDGTGTIYTVSVSWDDNRDGAVNGDDPTFQVAFQP